MGVEAWRIRSTVLEVHLTASWPSSFIHVLWDSCGVPRVVSTQHASQLMLTMSRIVLERFQMNFSFFFLWSVWTARIIPWCWKILKERGWFQLLSRERENWEFPSISCIWMVSINASFNSFRPEQKPAFKVPCGLIPRVMYHRGSEDWPWRAHSHLQLSSYKSLGCLWNRVAIFHDDFELAACACDHGGVGFAQLWGWLGKRWGQTQDENQRCGILARCYVRRPLYWSAFEVAGTHY